MNGFLYFLPATSFLNGVACAAGVTASMLESIGLSRVLDAGKVAACECERGPEEGVGRGLVVSHGGHSKVGIYPREQTWIKCAGGKFWLGWNTATPPGPVDLQRPQRERVSGYSYKLGDDRVWDIPAARIGGDEAQTLLPQRVRLDAEGRRVYEALPQYRNLSQYAAQTLAGFKFVFGLSDEPVVIDEDFKWKACVEALTTNYLVSEWEIGALGLITVPLYDTILSLLVDAPSLIEMAKARLESQKKSEPTSATVT